MASQSRPARRSPLGSAVVALGAGAALLALRALGPESSLGFVAPAARYTLGPEGVGLRGNAARTGLAAEGKDKEDEGGFMKFLKVEQDIVLTPEEYAVALDQEKEAQRKKYYINGEVKPNNLIVPWKPVDEKALEKEARRILRKNGISDPTGAGFDEDEEDTAVDIVLIGEQDVRVGWAGGTPGEKVGYIVESKLASATNFREVATYENMDTSFLLVKEYPGHEYAYTDGLVRPGAWTYRVLVRYRSGEVKVVDQKEIRVPEPSGVNDGAAFIAFGVLIAVLLVGSYLADQAPAA